MASREGTIYTRTYLISSPRQLVSGKGPDGGRLSPVQLLYEFRNHSNLFSSQPTALVSVSGRIIDTVNRAFCQCIDHGEQPENVLIVFIQVPPSLRGQVRIHKAEQLAINCRKSNPGFKDPKFFRHEFIIERAIPEECVLKRVSLRRLLKRGLSFKRHPYQSLRSVVQAYPIYRSTPTKELRDSIADELLDGDLWDAGVWLARFARCFGAEAPISWIANQLYDDCMSMRSSTNLTRRAHHMDGDVEEVFPSRSKPSETLQDGIETALVDWWLLNIDYESYMEWKTAMLEGMTADDIEYWETRHKAEGKKLASYQVALEDSWADGGEIKAIIQAEGVRIGL